VLEKNNIMMSRIPRRKNGKKGRKERSLTTILHNDSVCPTSLMPTAMSPRVCPKVYSNVVKYKRTKNPSIPTRKERLTRSWDDGSAAYGCNNDSKWEKKKNSRIRISIKKERKRFQRAAELDKILSFFFTTIIYS